MTAPCSEMLSAHIPPRPAAAATASKLFSRLERASDDDREAMILDELLAGNVPQFLRHTVAVVMPQQDVRKSILTVCVLPDYLAIGSDADFVIAPMRLRTAMVVAQRFGFLLPTPAIVDAIYRAAPVHLTPRPLPPGPQMRTTDYFWRHDTLIDAQRAAMRQPLGLLTAGHKKDLVITNRLWDNIARVAIYGWHATNGEPIQPLSTVHGKRYADYSHGVRLISETAYVDGTRVRLIDLLQDQQWAAVLNRERPIRRAADLVQALSVSRSSCSSGSRGDSSHGCVGP